MEANRQLSGSSFLCGNVFVLSYSKFKNISSPSGFKYLTLHDNKKAMAILIIADEMKNVCTASNNLKQSSCPLLQPWYYYTTPWLPQRRSHWCLTRPDGSLSWKSFGKSCNLTFHCQIQFLPPWIVTSNRHTATPSKSLLKSIKINCLLD